jgi:hypothetical protein
MPGLHSEPRAASAALASALQERPVRRARGLVVQPKGLPVEVGRARGLVIQPEA